MVGLLALAGTMYALAWLFGGLEAYLDLPFPDAG